MLDEQLAKKQDMQEESVDERMMRMDGVLDNLQTRFARLLADFNAMQLKLKQRVTKLEKQLTIGDDISTGSCNDIDGQRKLKTKGSLLSVSRNSVLRQNSTTSGSQDDPRTLNRRSTLKKQASVTSENECCDDSEQK